MNEKEWNEIHLAVFNIMNGLSDTEEFYFDKISVFICREGTGLTRIDIKERR